MPSHWNSTGKSMTVALCAAQADASPTLPTVGTVRVACRSVIRIARNAQFMAVAAEVSIFLHEPHPLLGATAQRLVILFGRRNRAALLLRVRAYTRMAGCTQCRKLSHCRMRTCVTDMVHMVSRVYSRVSVGHDV